MNLENDICRAITFINYHIPLVPDLDNEELKEQYLTLGFFDGMITERVNVVYREHGLKELWKYGLKRTKQSKGYYSYQNTFCFSQDEWNEPYTDSEFWGESTDEKYPLTFVVFLQVREYSSGTDAIAEQCRAFNGIAQSTLEEGESYTYSTVDKNDFVVCIKCRKYKNAVEAIKKLHGIEKKVVYSYTVFSIANQVLEKLSEGNYQDLYQENIKSICLKGITNSFDPEHGLTLDQRYYEFCSKLVERLFGKPIEELKNAGKEIYDYNIYDILGEDDFRLIARDVKLGNILQQFAAGGMLCYWEKNFQAYLFSSGLVLNTETDRLDSIASGYLEKNYIYMKENFSFTRCQELQNRMKRIMEVVIKYNDGMDEKMVTCCQAAWQLLQSLKTLEMAPVKRYDFWSLYHPLSLLISILELKMEDASGGNGNSVRTCEIFETQEIYDFIQKVSMTFHGTLRTDIQFFQIRDFNVTIHYAPAKLRAFYALWTLEVSRYYNEFCEPGSRNEYSFIFSPGMFRWTGVQELLLHYREKKRLMLITIPERHLYLPKWLLIIIAHEVSHFVGYVTRNRPARHRAWLKICARVLALEMYRFQYDGYPAVYKNKIEERVSEDFYLFRAFVTQLVREEDTIRQKSGFYPHEFHSENSFEIIEETFRKLGWNYIEKFVADDCEKTADFLRRKTGMNMLKQSEKNAELHKIRKLSGQMYAQQLILYDLFQYGALRSILNVIRHISFESYADLMAILTLDLEPQEYIASFVKGGMGLAELTEEEWDAGPLLFVRVGVTIKTICNIVMQNKWLESSNPRFYSAWPEDLIKKLPLDFPNESPESNMALKVYGYVTCIRNISEYIHTYHQLYDKNKEKFSNNQLDFLNDQFVFDAICDYLETSASIYMDKLRVKAELKEQKETLVSTYGVVSSDSASAMIQGVEDYLSEYEDKRVKWT